MYYDIKKSKYDTDLILDTFELERSIKPCDELNLLLNFVETQLPPNRLAFLEEKRQLLAEEGEFWNEEELKMRFLAHLFDVIKMDENKKIKTFYERSLVSDVNGHKLSVICDMLLATPLGIGTPKKPYFFLQEFKKAKNAPDAEGQMLIGMLIAQNKNANNKPIYGCCLQGKYWVFTVLHERKYCVSRSYDATDSNDLKDIVNILIQLKKVILEILIA